MSALMLNDKTVDKNQRIKKSYGVAQWLYFTISLYFFIFQHLGSRKLQLYNFIYLYYIIYIYDLLTLAPNEVMLCNVKPAADELSKSIRNAVRMAYKVPLLC